MNKKSVCVLFVCIHNSARSQMAEAFANREGNGRILAQSAGLEAGALNPLVVESMKERGIDISGRSTQTVQEVLEAGTQFDYVITVCDAARAEACPVFPGQVERRHWSFPDPSSFNGTNEEVLNRIRHVRDDIHSQVKKFIYELQI